MSATDQARPDLVGGGPHDYYSDSKPPSRGQNQEIARLTAELFGFDLDSRYDASVAIVRLRAACEQVAAGRDAAPRLRGAW